MANKVLKQKRRRQKRVRSKIVRQSEHPRLTVHRTNKHIYAQVIDDHKESTLAAVSDVAFDKKKGTKTEHAKIIGEELAAKLKKLKINQVVFDRGAFAYSGRIKALAEAVREKGITI